LLYAKARLAGEKRKKWILFAGCILAGILSLGSKEMAATLPFFIFLYEWYLFQDLSWTWLKRHLLPFVGILILFTLLAFMYVGAHPLEKILWTYQNRDFTLTQRVLTEFRVVIFYISLLIFPHPSRLSLEHNFPLSHSLINPITTMFSLGIIAGLIGLAIYMAKRERLLSFCILWFLGNLVIESSVIGLEIVFEHRNYLPSMLLCLMAVTWADRHIRPGWMKVAALCSVAAVFSFWTYERNNVWRDGITFWKDCVAKSPNKDRPLYNLGIFLAREGRIEEAMYQYQETLRINPKHAEARNNLGNLLVRQGRLQEAIPLYRKVLRIKPDYADAHNNLANTLSDLGRLEEALVHYSEALRIKPDFFEAHYNMGVTLVSLSRLEEAMVHYFEALRIKPDHAGAHFNLGFVLAGKGRLKEAVSHYTDALRINPDHAGAHNNLGIALGSQGKLKEAIRHFSEALRIKPDFPEVRRNLEHALRLMGKSAGAPNTVADWEVPF